MSNDDSIQKCRCLTHFFLGRTHKCLQYSEDVNKTLPLMDLITAVTFKTGIKHSREITYCHTEGWGGLFCMYNEKMYTISVYININISIS
jgi:hypothetical protein